MKFITCFLFFLIVTTKSYSCPLEPDLENDNAMWRLDPSLGIVVRFRINGNFVYYAHPEKSSPGSNARCIPHPDGGCKKIVVFRKRGEVVFIDGNMYHIATLTPIMCRIEGNNWEAFYKISHKRVQ